MSDKALRKVESDTIENKILTIRGLRVMLDSDLAQLYQVEIKNLKRAVKRNIKRFPPDFMIELTKEEYNSLRCQIVTIENKTNTPPGRGHYSKYLPFAFTEQGLAMLSGILTSDVAIDVNIAIMRAFVRLRQLVATNTEIATKISELEKAVKSNSSDIKLIFNTINTMLNPRAKKKPQIGFKPKGN